VESVETLIALLGLKPLPVEGGYYAESYRSAEAISSPALPGRYTAGPRSFGSAIYYLLTPQTCSLLHRLKSDEVYHFYLGDPVELLALRPDGSGEVALLGPDLARDMRLQLAVPHGVWQGSRLRAGGRYALLGTTMAPGFDPADFELGRRSDLQQRYPAFADLIEALTPSS
jgi:predicted cupin superfamily sugar epimerase